MSSAVESMSSGLVDKLLESIDDLERCIGVTKEVLMSKPGIPSEWLTRVSQYCDIVAKQRALAESLRMHLDAHNWDQVSRHVKLINALSSMIREDAQAILAGEITSPDDSEDGSQKMLIC